jgi:hypothetical protein
MDGRGTEGRRRGHFYDSATRRNEEEREREEGKGKKSKSTHFAGSSWCFFFSFAIVLFDLFWVYCPR